MEAIIQAYGVSDSNPEITYIIHSSNILIDGLASPDSIAGYAKYNNARTLYLRHKERVKLTLHISKQA
ncbi:hypothetical protein SAMN05518866_101360 [Sphingobium sp. YR768]|nr:hypothetical protein SAMN05518866_101360 [Sphingobium sp. YR768]